VDVLCSLLCERQAREQTVVSFLSGPVVMEGSFGPSETTADQLRMASEVNFPSLDDCYRLLAHHHPLA